MQLLQLFFLVCLCYYYAALQSGNNIGDDEVENLSEALIINNTVTAMNLSSIKIFSAIMKKIQSIVLELKEQNI
jgi:hypothetical protein